MPPVTSAAFWPRCPFARECNLTPPLPLSVLFFLHHFSFWFIILPLCSSFLLFAHRFCFSRIIIFRRRSSCVLFVGHSSSSLIRSPSRSSVLLFAHLFVHLLFSSFIISPLRASFLSSKVPPVTSAAFWARCPFARECNLTPPLPLSFLFFLHHFSFWFIILSLRSSFLLFAHRFSSLLIISPFRFTWFLLRSSFFSSFIIFPLRS